MKKHQEKYCGCMYVIYFLCSIILILLLVGQEVKITLC